MTVKITLKCDSTRTRTLEFLDDETFGYTAREFPDGRVEVTQRRRGGSDSGVVIAEFATRDIKVIDNGWPSDNGPLEKNNR